MRLIFFGDSFTYGQGYPDCRPKAWDELDAPSNLNWVVQVSTILGYEYVNKSLPAISNQEILKTLREYDRRSDDFVVIQWSYADRDMLLSTNNIERITPWFTGKVYEKYYKLHSDYDMNYRSDLVIEHADLMLRDTPHLMLANNRYGRLIDKTIVSFEMDYCVDRWPDGHPGEETNRRWAALVADMIKERGHWAP